MARAARAEATGSCPRRAEAPRSARSVAAARAAAVTNRRTPAAAVDAKAPAGRAPIPRKAAAPYDVMRASAPRPPARRAFGTTARPLAAAEARRAVAPATGR